MNKSSLRCLVVSGALFAGSLSAQEFRPLFDGKTLQGWHLQGSGEWKLVDGALVGTHVQSDKAFGHLVTDTAYSDFSFRYRWKLVRGNSGLYIRSTEGGEGGMIGPQVEMDEAYPGGIYATNTVPWGWVVQPKQEDIWKWYRPGQWNLVTVTAKGRHVEVTYNGILTAATDDARLPVQGRFGFQAHGGMDCEIWVDDVEMAAAPGPSFLALRGRASIPGPAMGPGGRFEAGSFLFPMLEQGPGMGCGGCGAGKSFGKFLIDGSRSPKAVLPGMRVAP